MFPSLHYLRQMIAAIFVGCGILAGSAGSGIAAPCAQPDVAAILRNNSLDLLGRQSDYFPSLQTTLLQVLIGGRAMQWLGAIWYGPINGALFLLDCAGEVVALRNMGGVTALRPGPLLPVGQSLLVSYIPSTGSGLQLTAVAIVAYREAGIAVLWEHVSREAISAGNLADYEDSFYWDLSTGGLTIRVTGRRKVGAVRDDQYGWAPGTINDLPVKMFCWNAADSVFLPCR